MPFVAAAPMLVLATATSLYLVGAESMRGLAAWDAAHASAYYGSFALALAINVAVIVEGVYRYEFNHDANERRRIRMAVYTAVPGVFAYAIKDGYPILAGLAGAAVASHPWPVTAFLQLLVLVPAFGLTYAVGVARVPGPALVLRRGARVRAHAQEPPADHHQRLGRLPAALRRDGRRRAVSRSRARASG